MKYLLTIFLATILGIGNMFAEIPVDMNVGPDETDDEWTEKKERPDKGRRIPPMPVKCTVDFEAGKITGTSAWIEQVEEYQLRDEENAVILLSDVDEAAFLKEVSHLPAGTYILVVRGSGYAMFGMLEL